MAYFIRLATVQDLDLIVPFFEHSLRSQFTHYSHNSVSYFLEEEYPREALEKGLQKRMLLFLAFDDLRPVGYLMTHKPYGGVAFANWFAVSDEYHGQGIGTSLLAAWEREAVERGAHKLLLWTTENNLAFYSHRGFTICGSMPDGYFGVNDYILYKTLKESNEEDFLKEYFKTREERMQEEAY